jgi:hypothetical protein
MRCALYKYVKADFMVILAFLEMKMDENVGDVAIYQMGSDKTEFLTKDHVTGKIQTYKMVECKHEVIASHYQDGDGDILLLESSSPEDGSMWWQVTVGRLPCKEEPNKYEELMVALYKKKEDAFALFNLLLVAKDVMLFTKDTAG